jgi:trk system potassium uptake protein TrkH
MQSAFSNLPLFLKLMCIAALAMWVPALVCLVAEQHYQSRTFFYSGLLGLTFVTIMGITLSSRKSQGGGLSLLIDLWLVYFALPAFLALPVQQIIMNTSYLNAYLDMVGALTTTGLRVFEDARLPEVLHFWRAFVAWCGGALIWIAAGAIFAPLNIGGYEVSAQTRHTYSAGGYGLSTTQTTHLLYRQTRELFPVYLGLTLILFILLFSAQTPAEDALIYAMSTMSTSGILPAESDTGVGFMGEAFVFAFLIFALSRLSFTTDHGRLNFGGLRRDVELRLASVLIIGVPLLLFLRHWAVALGIESDNELLSALRALWGALFTVASFLTTTGFISEYWQDAQSWSGLDTPFVLLMGLAFIGGGFATTAGGAKLLRVYVLYLSVRRELDKMTYPSSVGQSRSHIRGDLRQGANIAWVFFMIYVVAIAGFAVLFSALHLDFEQACVLVFAALTNTGPLLDVMMLPEIDLIAAPVLFKLSLALAMILGRLEILVVIALLSPSLWRR